MKEEKIMDGLATYSLIVFHTIHDDSLKKFLYLGKLI